MEYTHHREELLSMGFKKEGIEWLLDHLEKASKMDGCLGFNHKYRKNTRVNLLEIKRNPNGRFLQITEFMASGKTTFLVILKGLKSNGWETLRCHSIY